MPYQVNHDRPYGKVVVVSKLNNIINIKSIDLFTVIIWNHNKNRFI